MIRNAQTAPIIATASPSQNRYFCPRPSDLAWYGYSILAGFLRMSPNSARMSLMPLIPWKNRTRTSRTRMRCPNEFSKMLPMNCQP